MKLSELPCALKSLAGVQSMFEPLENSETLLVNDFFSVRSLGELAHAPDVAKRCKVFFKSENLTKVLSLPDAHSLLDLAPCQPLSGDVIDLLLQHAALLNRNLSAKRTYTICETTLYQMLMFNGQYHVYKSHYNLEAKLIIVPLLLEAEKNWVLVVFDTTERIVSLYNAHRSHQSPLTSHEQECMENLVRWIEGSKDLFLVDEPAWQMRRNAGLHNAVCINHFDCGMYTIAFALVLSSGWPGSLPLTIEQANIDALRMRCAMMMLA